MRLRPASGFCRQEQSQPSQSTISFLILNKFVSFRTNMLGFVIQTPKIITTIIITIISGQMQRNSVLNSVSKLMNSLIGRSNKPPRYSFKYVPPKINMRANIVPFHEWKGNRQRQQSNFNLIAAGVAFICFGIAKMFTLMIYDDYMGYYYQVNYPVLSRSVQLVHADLVDLTDPFFDIVPKDRYEIPAIYPRLYELIMQKQKKIAENDRKVMALRKEIQEFDEKHGKI